MRSVRTAPKPPGEVRGSAGDLAFFELMNSHLPRTFSRVMRHLPSEPRCRLCSAPYGGVGGRVMRRVGFGPSRKNPSLCNTCFEKAPMGGVEMEIGVLFADVRGFTTLAESMPPNDVADLLNRFYKAASESVSKWSIVDKLVGDEVMVLYVPMLMGERWEDEMVSDSRRLLGAVGFGSDTRPWLQLAVGLDVGHAYVGNVGSGEVKDFTALGDVVNTAARLQGAARAGQIVMSERLFTRLSEGKPQARAQTLALAGKAVAETVRVIEQAPG